MDAPVGFSWTASLASRQADAIVPYSAPVPNIAKLASFEFWAGCCQSPMSVLVCFVLAKKANENPQHQLDTNGRVL
jgi:hypothetical protein